MGTHGKLDGNMLRTGKNGKKKNPPPNPCPTPNLKEKKSRHFECMLSLPIGCMKFLCSSSFLARVP
jgi:hypothetical protein